MFCAHLRAGSEGLSLDGFVFVAGESRMDRQQCDAYDHQRLAGNPENF